MDDVFVEVLAVGGGGVFLWWEEVVVLALLLLELLDGVFEVPGVGVHDYFVLNNFLNWIIKNFCVDDETELDGINFNS